MDSFGDDTVIFVTITDGAKDRYGIPAVVRTPVTVTNCRFRPLSVDETVALTDVVTEMWRCTAPPHPAVLAAKSIDEVKHNGITYQLHGSVKPYPEPDSTVIHKVTVMCKKQTV